MFKGPDIRARHSRELCRLSSPVCPINHPKFDDSDSNLRPGSKAHLRRFTVFLEQHITTKAIILCNLMSAFGAVGSSDRFIQGNEQLQRKIWLDPNSIVHDRHNVARLDQDRGVEVWDQGASNVHGCFGICHSVFLSMMVQNGLGRDKDTLSSKELDNYQKYAYASQLVYIPTLWIAKLSTLFYLRALTPDSNYAILNRFTEVFVTLWALSAEISILFQCDQPSLWAVLSTEQCFNIGAFWIAIGALDIVSDSGIILLPIFIVWGLQMPLRRKALVFMAFGTRTFILPLSIIRLVVISSSGSPTLSNQTLVSYHNYFWTTVQLNGAIFFTCLPFLKPFMESMSSGGLAASVNAMDSSYSNNHSPSNSKLSTFLSSRSGWKSSKKNSTKTPHHLRTISSFQDHDDDDEISTPTTSSPNSNFKKSSPMFNFRFVNTNNMIAKNSYEGEELGTLRPDGAMNFANIRRSTPDNTADRSTAGSDKMIIRRTTECDVREDFESAEGRRTRSRDRAGDDFEIHKISMERRDEEAWERKVITENSHKSPKEDKSPYRSPNTPSQALSFQTSTIPPFHYTTIPLSNHQIKTNKSKPTTLSKEIMTTYLIEINLAGNKSNPAFPHFIEYLSGTESLSETPPATELSEPDCVGYLQGEPAAQIGIIVSREKPHPPHPAPPPHPRLPAFPVPPKITRTSETSIYDPPGYAVQQLSIYIPLHTEDGTEHDTEHEATSTSTLLKLKWLFKALYMQLEREGKASGMRQGEIYSTSVNGDGDGNGEIEGLRYQGRECRVWSIWITWVDENEKMRGYGYGGGVGVGGEELGVFGLWGFFEGVEEGVG
ncbi:hypothetical protein SBOR_3153 [Sclerotinia borealis F-4128]|uniref:Rhodopsin domain-containing protein n=1 Tax=Sclerotinia borealis (strain F-4128) TaxID=1432307 RepID=W9CKQ0_SCLBF|nr:hypothetical protein SBOR_3153 [Sclerotinia borealis F-4128]